MKQIVAGVGLLAVIALFCIVNAAVCRSIADRTQTLLDSAGQEPVWEERTRMIETTQAEWARHTAWLNCVMHHEDVEEVSLALARLHQDALSGEAANFYAHLAEIRLMLDHIAHSSSLSLSELFQVICPPAAC